MEITNERYIELVKTEMLYRMTKNALKNGVPYHYILVMLGEIVPQLAKVAVYNTPTEPTGNCEEAPNRPGSNVPKQPTVPPMPKAEIMEEKWKKERTPSSSKAKR